MITREQIRINQNKIKEKLEKRKADKETLLNEKLEVIRIKKEKNEDRIEQAGDRNDLAIMIAEKIKGVISSELESVVSGIEKLKIETPEIPEIEIPEIVLPKIELPQITIPEIKLPPIVIPKIETPIIPPIKIPNIIMPEMPKTPDIDVDRIVDAVIEGIQESFKTPLKVISIDENGDINKGRIIPGGGAYKWLKNTSGVNINPATEDSLAKLIGFEITKYDYIALTYVSAGNGAGEIETIVFKTGGSGGTTVATLTLAYNASDKISSITKT